MGKKLYVFDINPKTATLKLLSLVNKQEIRLAIMNTN